MEGDSVNMVLPPVTKESTPSEVKTAVVSKNKRPWLADNAVITLTDDINRFAFPHRTRPREINYLRNKGEVWKRIADSTYAYDLKKYYSSYPEN